MFLAGVNVDTDQIPRPEIEQICSWVDGLKLKKAGVRVRSLCTPISGTDVLQILFTSPLITGEEESFSVDFKHRNGVLFIELGSVLVTGNVDSEYLGKVRFITTIFNNSTNMFGKVTVLETPLNVADDTNTVGADTELTIFVCWSIPVPKDFYKNKTIKALVESGIGEILLMFDGLYAAIQNPDQFLHPS